MNMDRFKRILSMLLCVVLLMGNVPATVFATDDIAAQETTVPTEAPTEPPVTETIAPTLPPVPEETAAPTEAATEPPVPETVPATEPPVPEETAAPTEAPTEPMEETTPPTEPVEETTPPTEAEEPEPVVFTGYQTIVPDCDLPENEELHAAYAQQVLYGNSFSFFGTAAGARLTGDEKVIYDALVPIIKQIANGQRASTAIGIGQVGEDSSGNIYRADAEATFTGTSLSRESMGLVMDALLSDLPYEMYWFDKTIGCAWGYLPGPDSTILNVQLLFYVAENYRGSSDTSVDTAKTGAAAAAAGNAQDIVDKYAAASDYEKLAGYRSEICSLVTYNNDAANAGNFSENDDPWQLIYVFDGDTSTNVVCEGYSKAFMYLCDLTGFAGDVSCYTVSGIMQVGSSGGGHMWNIVTLEGSNYLVDVTNTDSGSIGQDGSLFLAGASGSAADGYTIGSCYYAYDNNTKVLWGIGSGSILTLSQTGYALPEPEPEGIGGTCGENLTWTLDDAGTLTISGTGAMTAFVSATDAPWYPNRTEIKRIVIGNGVTSISNRAFYGCTVLTDVTIGSGVTDIEGWAFASCINLPGITIPGSVATLGDNVFYNCTALTNVTIGSGVTAIGEFAFENCSSLKNITIPDSVTTIGICAFRSCTALTDVTIGNSVTTIGKSTFYNCTALANVTIGSGVTSIGYAAFRNCNSLVSITIPGSVSSIDTCAFYYCRALTDVTIGSGVTAIGESAFAYCGNLMNVAIPGSVTTIGDSAFSDCPSLCNVYYGGTAAQWNALGEDVPTAEFIHYSCENPVNHWQIASVEATCLHDGYTGEACPCGFVRSKVTTEPALGHDLGDWVVTKPASCNIIGQQRKDCSRCDYFETEQIAALTHSYADGVCTICRLPEGLKYEYNFIDGRYYIAITDYTGTAAEVVIPETIEGDPVISINLGAFSDCDKLRRVVLPDSITTIGEDAFIHCDNLISVELSEGLTSIGKYAFAYCITLDSMTLPDGITSIGECAFKYCEKMTSVTLPKNLTAISYRMFYECNWLGSIVIPDGVTSIGDDAFYRCFSLESIVLPTNVTSIGDDVFDQCRSLTDVYYAGTAEQWSALQGHPNEKYTHYSCVDPENHWTADTVDATCESSGYTCEVCPCGYKRDNVTTGTALGHDLGDWTVTTPASCTEAGQQRRSCSRCDYFETEEIAALTHSYEAVVTAPTCTADGFTTHTCSVCGDSYTDAPAAALDHDFGDWAVTKPASCTEAGQQRRSCSRCDYFETEEIAALTHSYEAVVTAPTCTADGFTTHTCSVCGDSYTDAPAAALDHDLSGWVITAPAGCTENGEQRRSCSRCDYFETEVLPAGHNYVDGVCTVCRNVLPLADGTCGENLTWVLDEDGNLTISGTGEMYEFASEAGMPWYDYREQIKSVVIEEGITSISPRAFYWHENLQRIEIPTTLAQVGEGAFEGCHALSGVYIRDVAAWVKISFADYNATPAANFLAEPKLYLKGKAVTSLTIPAGVTAIGDYAFSNFQGIKSVSLPKGLVTIGQGAFYGCTGLSKVVIPDSVTEVGSYAFSNCWKLSSVTIGKGLRQISEGMFSGCEKLTAITIPATVNTIGLAAFNASGLKSIKIPDTVTFVGGYAFSSCSDLKSASVGKGITTLSEELFSHCTSLESVVLPAGLTTIDAYAFNGCTALTKIEIPDSVTEVYYGAFYYCDSLTDVKLSSGMSAIMEDTFYGCIGLERIVIPANIKYICTSAFAYCQNLKEAVILSGTTDVEDCAFYHCDSLETVVIPETVTFLGGDVFGYCTALQDVYYGGTAAQWDALPSDLSADVRVHLSCTDHKQHWETVTVAATCEEMGYVFERCACGFERNRAEAEPALGHTIVTDAAVVPTCIDDGLTAGEHCANCGYSVPQEIIPAPGHAYEEQADRIVCSVCNSELYVRIRQDIVALALQEADYRTAQLEYELSHDHLEESLQWSIEGEDGIIRVDENGVVTAEGVGTVYVVATVSEDGFEATGRCRIDVTEHVRPEGIRLSTTTLTTELYKTDYTGFEILLQLPQNYPVDGTVARTATMAQAGSGVAMTTACFTESEVYGDLSRYFQLVILDDRSVRIIPTDYAVENPKEVKSQYKNITITVTVQGEEFVSEKLTLNVKKTVPKLTGTVAAFNSFYSGQTHQITIKGATPVTFYENEAKNTAKTTALPKWVALREDGCLSLTEDAPLKSVSGSAYLMVDTQEWRIPAAVTVSVKNTFKAPSLKLSATTVTMTKLAESSDGIGLKLLCTNKKDTLEALHVAELTAPEGYRIESFCIEDGSFILRAEEGFRTGSVVLTVHFADTDVTRELKVTVKTANVTLKLGTTGITLNKKVSDSIRVKVTATPADYRLEEPDTRLTATEKVNGKNTTVDKTDSGVLDIEFVNGELSIRTTDLTPDKATYKLYVSSGGSKEVAATINVISGNPSVTFKASGSMDLSFPAQTATIKPTFKNYKGEITDFDYTVSELKGSKVVKEDVSGMFAVTFDGAAFRIRCTDDEASTANTYKVKLTLTLNDGSTVSNTVSMKVKRTAVKLKLGATKLTLNKLIGDEGSIALSCATKGYAFTEPLWSVTDKYKRDAADQLDIRYENGKLYVATKDETVYGMTYTVALKANEKAAAQNLTVTIPTEAKSNVTVTIKAGGKIDVIRDGSAITVTPTYKNRLTASPAEEQLYIYGPVSMNSLTSSPTARAATRSQRLLERS